VRFVVTGGLAALVQLGLLQVWTVLGWDPLPANVVAFLGAAQVNFWLSQLFTWGDRGGTRRIGLSVVPRWARFHAAISGTALLNMAVFALARTLLPSLLAAALGIAVAAVLNFVLADRFVFRPADRRTARSSPPPRAPHPYGQGPAAALIVEPVRLNLAECPARSGRQR
jgi:putative flippase GtrA